MLAAVSRAAARRAVAPARMSVRAFAGKLPEGVDGKIPTDLDQQTGRRMAEIKYEMETGVSSPPGRWVDRRADFDRAPRA